MKTLIHVMVLSLVITSPLCADVVVFQEDFEGDASGTALNTLGWTGDDNIVISSAVLDSGQSADWSSSSAAWPKVTKGFSYAPGAGETYTLSATMYAPGTTGEFSGLIIRDSANPDDQNIMIRLGYDEIKFGLANVDWYAGISPQPTGITDVKMDMQGTTADLYYRAHGVGAWTHVGQKTGLGWSTAVYDEIMISGHGGVAGGLDSVLLTSDIPEPSSIMLIVTGLIGLLAYAWRKRK